MAEQKPIDLTEDERKAAERDAALMEAARQFNALNGSSAAGLPPGAIPISDLDAAASCGQVYRVKLALNNGADVNEAGPFGSALHGAAENGHLDVVRLLVDNGANVRLLDPNGRTPCQAACQGGHQAVADFLGAVEKGEQV